MFYGRPGCGKTTLAKLINPESTFHVNCTMQNSISDIRHLDRICSSAPVVGEKRLVLFDEADYLSKDAQAALRGFVERHSGANDFIMTANEINRLSEPIQSRFYPVSFDFLLTDEFKIELVSKLKAIAEAEGCRNVDTVLLNIIVRQSFPDIRSMIKRMQYELLYKS